MNSEHRSVYLDNHATTRLDPRVMDAMRPYFLDDYGNAASINHQFGDRARDAVVAARQSIAEAIGAKPAEIVFTSGATEANNLAIKGIAESRRRRGDHVVTVQTEHRAVLDPVDRLRHRGFDVTLLPVRPHTDASAGVVDLEQVADALRDETCLVSVMLANNEIGTLQPLAEIGRLCQEAGIPFHADATQAVGKLPVNVDELNLDLMSFSAHKMYGPKGVGALFVGRRRRVRLEPQVDGGGQENGLRSGTTNVPGVIGMAAALSISLDEMESETARLLSLRQLLFDQLLAAIPDCRQNGPDWKVPGTRLPGNLNVRIPGIDGEALLMQLDGVAVSSGSACTSTDPEPSHVLRALGLDEDDVRASIRFGIGRFNDTQDVAWAVDQIQSAVKKLRALG